MSCSRRIQVLFVVLLLVPVFCLNAQTNQASQPAQAGQPAQADQPAKTSPTNNALAAIKKIYVAPMDNHLDQYITSEISKQFKGTLEVVTDPAQADAVLKAVNLAAQNTSGATVNLTDPAGKSVLWSGTASDKENKFLDLKHGGLQTVAAHLVGEMKKAMRAK